MGRSEWGFYVETTNDLLNVLDFIKLHNNYPNSDVVGEPLELYAVIRFKNKLYVCVGNGGGRNETSEFIIQNYTGPRKKGQIYFPFNKPQGWNDCQDYVWKADDDKPIESIFIS